MTVQALINKAITSPDATASTTRFYLRDKTLYCKSERGSFIPLLTYTDELLIKWTIQTNPRVWARNTSLWGSSRTSNMVSDAIHRVSGGWIRLAKLKMVVTIAISPETQYFPEIKNLEKGTSFMLLRGLLPPHVLEDGSQTQCPRIGWDGRHDILSMDDQDLTPESLEQSFRRLASVLAWGTISRENYLRDEAKQMLQLVDDFHAHSTNLREQLVPLIECNFAPKTPNTDVLNRSRFNDAVTSIHTLGKLINQSQRQYASVTSQMFTKTDYGQSLVPHASMVVDPKFSREMFLSVEESNPGYWSAGSVPGIMTSKAQYERDCHADAPVSLTDPGWSMCIPTVHHSIEEDGEPTEARTVASNIWIRALGPQAASFYDLQNRFGAIQEALGKIFGWRLPNVDNKPAKDWDYMEFATPIFLERKDK